MNTNYTDDQIQTAIDAAFPQAGPSFLANLDTSPDTHCWPAEAPNRLAIARAFLAALPKPEAMTSDEGAPATSDPYALLKAYNKAGARIRIDAGLWETKDQYPWKFDAPPHDYEVHPDDLHMVPEYVPKTAPWTLPAPPPGRKWHREDWTADMLPEGYRPLLEDEPWMPGDEILRYNEWHVAGQHEDDAIGSPTTEYKCHCRTRRPLPTQVNAEPMEQAKPAEKEPAVAVHDVFHEAVPGAFGPDFLKRMIEAKPASDASPDWIPHDGGPCPLKDEEVEEWEFKFRDGDIRRVPGNPNDWIWRHLKEAGDIIAYRVLKWKLGYGPQAAQYHMPKLPNPLAPPMIRLRLPSEKPTWQDADGDGFVVVFSDDGVFFCQHKDMQKRNDLLGWIPGHVPDEIRPNEPTQEEQWRSEFEACFPDFDLTKQDTGGYLHAHAATAWRAFLAAKKGGAK